MSILRLAALGAATASMALAAADVQGDAQRGEQLFQTELCVQCHAVNGRGGSLGPDLGKRIDRDFTPASMASLMWNHGPEMWSAMRKAGIVKETLSPESAVDLFAYFTAARYFEKPGDAARGKQAFTALHCSECHGVTTSNAANAPPVVKWESLADPVVLVQQMWNHGGRMRQAYADRKLRWSPVISQQLKDILVYLQGLPENRALVTAFAFQPSETGAQLFQSIGCSGCHTGKLALETLLRNQSLTDVARRVFMARNCASCHDTGANGAPKLGKTPEGYSDVTMMSTLWDHGPRMLEVMNERKLPWPTFSAPEMTDLIAYLNSP